MPRPRRPAPSIPDERTRSDDAAPLTRAPVRVQAFGAARILVGDQVLGPANIVLFSVLLRLVYSPGMVAPRDLLCRELWPHQALLRQRGNLRQAMYKLRLLGVQVTTDGDLVRLDRSQVVRTFAVDPTPELFDRDITRGQEPFGPFLPGFVAITDEFQEWVESTRERVHSDLRRVLVEFLRSRRERADWTGAEALARWVLELDPLNEDATLTTAECAMLRGSKIEAVAILDRYLLELGPRAGDIRLPAAVLRKRFVEPGAKRRAVALVTTDHFLGRERDVTELTLALRRARWHDGSAVLLHGPPGIGKSRVLIELSKVAQVEGYHEITLECRESIQSRPLGALLEVLPELLSKPGALGCSPESLALIRKLLGMVPSREPREGDAEEAATDSDDATSAPSVSGPASPAADHTVSGAVAPGAESTSPIPPGTPPEGSPTGEPPSAMERFELALRTIRAQSIRHAVVDLFASLTEEKPIFVIVEDAHWIDDATWEVLSDVIQRVGEMRVFMVLASHYGTVREERPARMSARLEVRRLPALGPELMETLAHAIAKEQNTELPPSVVSWLLRCSEGTPLLLRALLEHWVQTGQSEGMPPTLTMLIDARLDRLDATSLRALQAIALLARFASLDRIKVVLELPIHELIRALDQLESTGCLASSQASLVITHDLVRQMAERRMSPLVETALRATIGDALEAEYLVTRDVPTLLEAMLHIELSRRPEVLYRFVIRHEEALLDSGRPAAVLRAIDSVQQAIPLAEDDRTLHRMKLRLMTQDGNFGKALAIMPGGMALPSTAESLDVNEVDEYLSFVEASYRADPLADKEALGRFALSVVLNDALPSNTKLRAADIGLIIAGNVCDPELARCCYYGLNMSEKEMFSGQVTQRIALLFHTAFGSVDTADKLAQSMFERGRKTHASTGAIHDCTRSGFVFRMIGETARAVEALTVARQMAFDIGSPRLAEYPIWHLAQAQYELGDLNSALNFTEELRELAASNMDDAANSYIHAHLCAMAIAVGDPAEAEVQLRKCESPQANLPLRAKAYTTGLTFGVALMDPNWRPGESDLALALDRFERTREFCASDLFAAFLGKALARVNRIEEAQELLADYLKNRRRERSTPTGFLSEALRELQLS